MNRQPVFKNRAKYIHACLPPPFNNNNNNNSNNNNNKRVLYSAIPRTDDHFA